MQEGRSEVTHKRGHLLAAHSWALEWGLWLRDIYVLVDSRGMWPEARTQGSAKGLTWWAGVPSVQMWANCLNP